MSMFNVNKYIKNKAFIAQRVIFQFLYIFTYVRYVYLHAYLLYECVYVQNSVA